MKTILNIALIVILVLVVFGLNQEYGWIEFKWSGVAIAAAALAGPFQFIKNKMDESKEDRDNEEKVYKYRVLKHKEFMAREKSKTRLQREDVNKSKSEKEVPRDEFYTENADG